MALDSDIIDLTSDAEGSPAVARSSGPSLEGSSRRTSDPDTPTAVRGDEKNHFVPADESANKNRCKHLFCYVCNWLAMDCSKRDTHCDASDSGTHKEMSEALRNLVNCQLGGRDSPSVCDSYDPVSTVGTDCCYRNDIKTIVMYQVFTVEAFELAIDELRLAVDCLP